MTLVLTYYTPYGVYLHVSSLVTIVSPFANYIMASNPRKIEGAPAHGNAANLLPPHFKQTVSEWLREDAPSFDYGGFVVGESPAEAKLLGKSPVRVVIVMSRESCRAFPV